MFDNNATGTLHNISETLEIECETGSATYDVQLTGSNPTPDVNGLTVVDQLSEAATSILGVDNGITAAFAHNSNIPSVTALRTRLCLQSALLRFGASTA